MKTKAATRCSGDLTGAVAAEGQRIWRYTFLTGRSAIGGFRRNATARPMRCLASSFGCLPTDHCTLSRNLYASLVHVKAKQGLE
jgi:hypothetical protein